MYNIFIATTGWVQAKDTAVKGPCLSVFRQGTQTQPLVKLFISH